MRPKNLWRWTSTPLSADRGEISILACIESFVAIAITLIIAWYYETLNHIVVSSCIAPILMLRSKRSSLIGLKLYDDSLRSNLRSFGYQFIKWIEFSKKGSRVNIFSSLSLITLPIKFIYIFIILPFLIRFFATLLSFCARPIYTVMQIPGNWFRVVFCTDLARNPEIMPGIERVKRKKFHQIDAYRFDDIGKTLVEKGEKNSNSTYVKFGGRRYVTRASHYDSVYETKLHTSIDNIINYYNYIFFIFSLIFSLVYRLSLKSTSLIWSPLLWVISDAQTPGAVRGRLDRICNLAFYRMMRFYSVIVVVIFLAKMLILFGSKSVALGADLRPFLEPFIEPASLPLWQVGSFVNSLLAFGLWILADWHLRAIENGEPNRTSEWSIKMQISSMSIIRNILALYTVACTLYIAWKISADLNLPYVELILFPWS